MIAIHYSFVSKELSNEFAELDLVTQPARRSRLAVATLLSTCLLIALTCPRARAAGLRLEWAPSAGTEEVVVHLNVAAGEQIAAIQFDVRTMGRHEGWQAPPAGLQQRRPARTSPTGCWRLASHGLLWRA